MYHMQLHKVLTQRTLGGAMAIVGKIPINIYVTAVGDAPVMAC